MEDNDTAALEAEAAAPAPSAPEADEFAGEDFSAVDAILSREDPPEVGDAPEAPAEAVEPPKAAAATPAPEPADIPVEKLLALLTEKKKVTEGLSEDRSKLASERAELEAARAAMKDAQALVDMARRDPAKFFREHVKAQSLEQVARDLYFAEKGGEKAPEQYQATQRTRELEAELAQLRQEVRAQSEQFSQSKVEQDNARLVNEYKARAKEAVAKHDAKVTPWVARAFGKNPDKVMDQLVGLASYVARERGEVVEPQELIPILEAGMVEQFGKYDFGEARPATTTLKSSLASPARRAPVTHEPEDRDASIEDTVKAILSGNLD